MSKQSFRDLKETIELKDGEIDELTMELESKKEEIIKRKIWNINWIMKSTMKRLK